MYTISVSVWHIEIGNEMILVLACTITNPTTFHTVESKPRYGTLSLSNRPKVLVMLSSDMSNLHMGSASSQSL